jgi:cytochrome c peroxidase
MRGDWALVSRTSKRAAIAIAAVALICGAAGSPFGAPQAGLAALKRQYWRPAAIPYPKENPHGRAKEELGRALFFDPILSGARVRSCGTCHNPGLAWGDGEPRAIGENGVRLPLRSPTLLNIAWVPKLGWDGHFRDLESVAMGPITGQTNMNLPEQELIERLSALPGYRTAFDTVFGKGDVTRQKIEQSLATFERTIVSGDAPFDRWAHGDEAAISAAAKRGFALFNGKANCAVCHTGWAFTDAAFHDIGVAKDDDLGRGRLFPSSVKLQHAFKTPTLRDVARRAPYMHDGSVTSLAEVIDLYDRGGIERPSRDNDIRPLNLQSREKADLIAFLNTLSDAPKLYPLPNLPR